MEGRGGKKEKERASEREREPWENATAQLLILANISIGVEERHSVAPVVQVTLLHDSCQVALENGSNWLVVRLGGASVLAAGKEFVSSAFKQLATLGCCKQQCVVLFGGKEREMR